MEDSKSRKGWMQGPIAAPGGVVVLHATINISRWYCLLPNKICKLRYIFKLSQNFEFLALCTVFVLLIK